MDIQHQAGFRCRRVVEVLQELLGIGCFIERVGEEQSVVSLAEGGGFAGSTGELCFGETLFRGVDLFFDEVESRERTVGQVLEQFARATADFQHAAADGNEKAIGAAQDATIGAAPCAAGSELGIVRFEAVPSAFEDFRCGGHNSSVRS